MFEFLTQNDPKCIWRLSDYIVKFEYILIRRFTFMAGCKYLIGVDLQNIFGRGPCGTDI